MIDRAAFFASVRADFGRLTQPQVNGFSTILDAWGDADLRFIAYSLATTWHETAKTMQPIEEYGKGRGRAYGPSGFYGRGYVQLTWEDNYRRAGQKLGADFVRNPRLVMEPKYAVQILVRGMSEGWFTGKKLADFFNATKNDPRRARQIINGMDRADLIAGYHAKFLKALTAAKRADPPAPPPDIEPVAEAKPAPARRFWNWLRGVA